MNKEQFEEAARKMINEKTSNQLVAHEEVIDLMLKFGYELCYAAAKVPLRRDVISMSHAYKVIMDEYVNPIKFQ